MEMDIIDIIDEKIKQTNRTFTVNYRWYFHERGTTLKEEESENSCQLAAELYFLSDQDKRLCFETDKYWSVSSGNRKGINIKATGSCLKTLLEWIAKETDPNT